MVEATQRSPDGQSRDSVHCVWQRLNAQTNGALQSLLIEQPCSRLAADGLLLQPEAPATAKSARPVTNPSALRPTMGGTLSALLRSFFAPAVNHDCARNPAMGGDDPPPLFPWRRQRA